ncbi:MAG: hypothetical protein ACXVCE_06830, partial [Bacteriovorax sp.]
MQKNKWFPLTMASIALLSSSCALLKSRKPASESETFLAQIYNEINRATPLIGTDSLNCKKAYDGLYQKLFNIAGASASIDVGDVKAIDQDIQGSFETRIALKSAFAKFSLSNAADSSCLASAQDVFKALRYVEDYLIEVRMDNRGPAEYMTLIGTFPYLLVNPKYASEFSSYKDLKSGDVILSRGNAYSSAAIARIAKSDYQFSHLSFVYRDPDTRELFTSEAHIEIGSVTAPFIDHINEKNVRSVVFRYKDEDVAHRASKAMFDLIKKHQDKGKTIDYDFSMNYKDDSKLFCSEVISDGFKLVLPNEDFFPKFKSKFTSGIIPFLNTIGVPVSKENIESLDVFAPGDIQFDPRFELVAEWRNPKKLEETRLKDFILTKMFERMDQAGYKIDPSFKMGAEVRSYWLLRRTPLVKKFLEKKFSLTMNTAQMELFMALDLIGDAFYKNLEQKSLEYDHPMTPKEVYAAIDEF